MTRDQLDEATHKMGASSLQSGDPKRSTINLETGKGSKLKYFQVQRPHRKSEIRTTRLMLQIILQSMKY